MHDTEKQVVIVGDRNHPEVMGIFGWCRNPALVVSSYDEAAAIEADDLFVVTQTTIKEEMLSSVTDALSAAGRDFTVNNTICSATTKRQQACEKLAHESDLMIVIGGRKSSNTKKLCEISKKFCANTYFVENIEDLPLKEVQKCDQNRNSGGRFDTRMHY